MNTEQLFSVTLHFLLVTISSISFGFLIIERAANYFSKKKVVIQEDAIAYLGLALLLGLGALGFTALLLGLTSIFTQSALYFTLFIFLVASVKQSFFVCRYLLWEAKNSLVKLLDDPLSLLMIVVSFLILGTLYLSSLRPPYSIDELAYHFPQAISIVEKQKVEFVFLGGPFYGNIPKLMEVLFAVGISLSGYSLAHAINFAFLLGFVVFIFGFLRKRFGVRAGVFAVFLLSLFDDFTWNSTTGYIDSATSILEVSSLILVAEWLSAKTKKNYELLLAGFLMGFSVGMKYSPLPTAALILVVVLFYLLKEKKASLVKSIKTISFFLIPALLVGGYWYLKNLVLFRNPFYPLYFGHEGMTELEYTSLINAIQQFKPKTVSSFFEIIGHFKTVNAFTVYLTFFAFPLALLVKRGKVFIKLLLTFYVLYILYWFFFATHQIRFLTTAIVVSTILLSIFLSSVPNKVLLKTFFALFIVSLVVKFAIKPFSYQTVWTNYWYSKFNVGERQYAVGNETEEMFMSRHFGCKYHTMKYLEGVGYSGKIMDNWSVWLGRPWPLLPGRNNFITYAFEAEGKSELKENLINSKIGYVFISEKAKQRHLENTNPYIIQTRDLRLSIENLILEDSELVYENSDCKLYKINFDNGSF